MNSQKRESISMFKPQQNWKWHLFLTYLVFENLRDNHGHIVLSTSLKGRRDERKVFKHLYPFFFSLSLHKENVVCLLWCSAPDRHSLVFSVQQFCALEDGSFVLAKRHHGRWTSIDMQQELKCESRALRRTYIYLGFGSICANDVQLLYG